MSDALNKNKKGTRNVEIRKDFIFSRSAIPKKARNPWDEDQ